MNEWIGFGYCPKCRKYVELYMGRSEVITCGYCRKILPIGHHLVTAKTLNVLKKVKIMGGISE